MSCGDGDLFCDVLSLAFGDHGLVVSAAAKSIWAEHGERLIAAAGLAFGIWKWWVYRERILHERLEEYITESDRRLVHSEKYILDAIQRPRPSHYGKLPLFASSALRRVLVRHNWDGTVLASSVEASVDAQLDNAKKWIDQRLQTAEASTVSLRKQLATVHILKGAVASSDPDGANRALKSFRAALAVPGHDANLTAIELQALQLRNEGKIADALNRFVDVEQLALQKAVDRDGWLIVARAKRYQAELIQASQTFLDATGKICFSPTNAFHLLSPDVPGSAIAIRVNHGPYDDWEQIEQAELHYLAAFLANVRKFNLAEPLQLKHATSAYEDVLARRVSPVWKRTPNQIRLRKAASEGLNRAKAAASGSYDTKWMFPYLNQP